MGRTTKTDGDLKEEERIVWKEGTGKNSEGISWKVEKRRLSQEVLWIPKDGRGEEENIVGK